MVESGGRLLIRIKTEIGGRVANQSNTMLVKEAAGTDSEDVGLEV